MTPISTKINFGLLDHPKHPLDSGAIHSCIVCWVSTKSLGIFIIQNENGPKQRFSLLWVISHYAKRLQAMQQFLIDFHARV